MKFTLTFVSALFFGASAAVAAPSTRSCSLKDAKVPFPAGQTALVVPTGSPSFIGLGVGVQNYTCNATSGTYVSAGAVAELFDLSCLYKMPNADQIPAMALKAWEVAPASMTIQKVIAGISKINYLPISNEVLGQHYFVRPTPGGAISPKWDFTSSGATKGNANAFVIGAKDAQLAAPNAATDVAWLQLHGTSGKLATSVYRVLTAGGQPPASCTAGSADISVKYTSDYYFYGSSL